MDYADNFTHADDVVLHLNGVVPSLDDPLLQAKYVGFVAVAAVTVYEIAIKEIFISFGTKKHRTLGAFTESFFDRINGRIRLDTLKNDYISPFGDRYKKRFTKNLETRSQSFFRQHRRDVRSAYGNIIVWRNDFAHKGLIRTTATYPDVVQSYEDGKEVIHCLAQTMTR
jgi:hypothetical protein